jgi:hypothetical protein
VRWLKRTKKRYYSRRLQFKWARQEMWGDISGCEKAPSADAAEFADITSQLMIGDSLTHAHVTWFFICVICAICGRISVNRLQ